MKRLIALFLPTALLLCGCAQGIKIDESTIVTRTGTIADHAMATPSGGNKVWDESYPYLTIEFEYGTVLCVWNMNEISEDVKIGDTVEITYGIRESSDLAVMIEVKKVE